MKSLFILLLLSLAMQLQAQYTYISDRRFFDPVDLPGYDFKPFMKEVAGSEAKEEIDAGSYSFGITTNNLYVEGEGIQGVYNINNIQPVEYGFKLLLMNARDARLQGHLKIIVNKYRMVESIIFKRSPNEKEIIFYLSPIPNKTNDLEKDYFTDRGEMAIVSTDSIWGKRFHPFLRIHLDAKVQERLYMRDSTSVSFEKVTVVEEKEVKKKKPKEGEEEVAAVDTLPLPPVMDSLGVIDSTVLNDPNRKFKITTEYFVIVRSILEYDDGTKEDKTWKYPVKKVVEKEDKLANDMQERYQWEFVNDKKEHIMLYLNGDHTVSTFEVGMKKYMMRGF